VSENAALSTTNPKLKSSEKNNSKTDFYCSYDGKLLHSFLYIVLVESALFVLSRKKESEKKEFELKNYFFVLFSDLGKSVMPPSVTPPNSTCCRCRCTRYPLSRCCEHESARSQK